MLTILADEIRKESEIKGIEKGKIEGKIEEKIEAAKKMRKKGLEINLIHEITGLTIDEIKKL